MTTRRTKIPLLSPNFLSANRCFHLIPQVDKKNFYGANLDDNNEDNPTNKGNNHNDANLRNTLMMDRFLTSTDGENSKKRLQKIAFSALEHIVGVFSMSNQTVLDVLSFIYVVSLDVQVRFIFFILSVFVFHCNGFHYQLKC